ncbi:MAG: hypothetical protein KA537_00875 [Candidatus Moranbacteria bacterium]|nr:hypothetical protein [Candidatus Moranbacteria bacterium]
MGNELYEESYKNPKHFSFGRNWQNFLKNLTDKRIKEQGFDCKKTVPARSIRCNEFLLAR